jgi:aspartate oxidase
MKIVSQILVVIVGSVLAGAVAATNVHPVYAVQDPENKVAFKKITHEIEKGGIAAVEDPENIPESLNAYRQDVLRIFSGHQNIDQVRTLLKL